MNETPKAIFVVIFLVVGMAIAGLLYTFTSVLQGQTFEIVESDIDNITSYFFANFTFVGINNTWVSIGNDSIEASSLIIYDVTNMTDNTSQFTLNATTGYVQLDSTGHDDLNESDFYAHYDHDDESIKTAIQSGILSNFEAQQQIADYLPIITLAIIIVIIIGLIIGGIASKFIGPMMGGYGGFGGYGNQGLL